MFVATVEFEDGAERQAAALGADVASVLVSHPIQDRTPEEIRALADNAFEEIIKAVSDAA